MIVMVSKDLKKEGISVRLVEIAEELDGAARGLTARTGQACPMLLALYTSLRESQGVTGRSLDRVRGTHSARLFPLTIARISRTRGSPVRSCRSAPTER